MVVGDEDGYVEYFENTGSASSPTWSHESSDWLSYDFGREATPTFADISSDGDYDLAVGCDNETVTYYENTGSASSPTWTYVTDDWLQGSTDHAAGPAAADMDNDGDYDLLVGVDPGVVYYFRNDNDYVEVGEFTSQAINILGSSPDYTTVEWTEVIAANSDVQIRIRSASTEGGLSSATWYGPTGTSDYYSTSTGQNINSTHDGDSWFQYKAFLSSTEGVTIPVLDDITVNFTYMSVFAVDSSGNFGMGTAPSEYFDIAGNFKIDEEGTVTDGTWNGAAVGTSYGGTGTSTAFTAGSVVFAGTDGVYSQDNTGLFFNSTSNKLSIGNNNSALSTLSIASAGNYNGRVWIAGNGTGSTTYGLVVRESTDTVNNFFIRDDGYGYLRTASWAYGSDRRLKENIQNLDYGLDAITQLNPQQFDYINGVKDQFGFIAQDVQPIIPELVSVQEDGMLSLQTDMLIPIMVNAMQEQQFNLEENTGNIDNINLQTNQNITTLEELQTSIDNNLLTISDELNNQNIKLTELEDQMKDIDLNLINTQVNELMDFMLAIGADEYIKVNELITGNILLDGKLEAEEVEAGTLTIKVIEKESATIGQATICSIIPIDEDNNNLDDCSNNPIPTDKDNNNLEDTTNEPMPIDEDNDWIDDNTNEPIVNNGRTVTIETTAITDNSKIFVTPKISLDYSLSVSEIVDGESFKVKIKNSTEEDIEFDWWIVEASK